MDPEVNLDGTWQYLKDLQGKEQGETMASPTLDRSAWSPMTLPTNWIFTEVGDYGGVIWFAREFDAARPGKGERCRLHFGAVDYIADVWLNGAYLGRHEGYFAPFAFEVGHLLKDKNVVVVRVDSPIDTTPYMPIDAVEDVPMSAEYQQHFPVATTIIKGGLIVHKHRPGGQTKFGQKGNTGGIWQSVSLKYLPEVAIERTAVHTTIVKEYGMIRHPDARLEFRQPEPYSPDRAYAAIVTLDLVISNHADTPVKVDISAVFADANFEGDTSWSTRKGVVLAPGVNAVTLAHTIEDVQLWWTWDHGKPNLYTVDVSLVSEGRAASTQSTRFGVVEIRHDEQTHDWFLNDRRIFVRGMRYNPSQWLSDIDAARYERDIRKMIDCGINSIRLGSQVEKTEFHDLCDELGILVWQVFPLHYSVSDSDDVIQRAAEMTREMVRMLVNHPSTMAYSVYKEPEIYRIGKQHKAPNNYGRICQVLHRVTREEDPTRWVHKGDYREGVQNVTIGNSRPWNLDLHELRLEPMAVEFGAAVIPKLESLRQMMPDKDIWPPNWDEWAVRAHSYASTMNGGHVVGSSIEEFIESTQVYMKANTKEVLEFLRQRKYSPITTIYYYYWAESYPGLGTGLLDYFDRENGGLEGYRQANTPVLVSFEWERGSHIAGKPKHYAAGEALTGKVWVTNDLNDSFSDAVLELWLVDKSGKPQWQNRSKLDIDIDSNTVAERIDVHLPAGLKESGRFEMKLSTAGAGKILSENTFEFVVD